MMQDEIRAAIAAMPVAIEPQFSNATRALYEPLHASVTNGTALDADVAYGPHARHKLDVRTMAGGRHEAIVIFVHGGGFTSGDKRAFGNIGGWCAKSGILGITMTYRLAPEALWPAGAQDVAAAVAWARANAVGYNGDPQRIVQSEVIKALTTGQQLIHTLLWWTVVQTSMRVAVGTALWIIWGIGPSA